MVHLHVISVFHIEPETMSKLRLKKQVFIRKYIQMMHCAFFLSVRLIYNEARSFRITHCNTNIQTTLFRCWLLEQHYDVQKTATYLSMFSSADMQHGGSYGGDLLFGEISYHQRGPGGKIIYDLLYVHS